MGGSDMAVDRVAGRQTWGLGGGTASLVAAWLPRPRWNTRKATDPDGRDLGQRQGLFVLNRSPGTAPLKSCTPPRLPPTRVFDSRPPRKDSSRKAALRRRWRRSLSCGCRGAGAPARLASHQLCRTSACRSLRKNSRSPSPIGDDAVHAARPPPSSSTCTSSTTRAASASKATTRPKPRFL